MMPIKAQSHIHHNQPVAGHQARIAFTILMQKENSTERSISGQTNPLFLVKNFDTTAFKAGDFTRTVHQDEPDHHNLPHPPRPPTPGSGPRPGPLGPPRPSNPTPPPSPRRRHEDYSRQLAPSQPWKSSIRMWSFLNFIRCYFSQGGSEITPGSLYLLPTISGFLQCAVLARRN